MLPISEKPSMIDLDKSEIQIQYIPNRFSKYILEVRGGLQAERIQCGYLHLLCHYSPPQDRAEYGFEVSSLNALL